MSRITGEEARIWGGTMVGFGSYHYKYDSGKVGDWFLTGFSPRKQNLTIYIMAGFDNKMDLMKDLGKYKTGSSCLYVKKLSDIDKDKLSLLIDHSVKEMASRYK